MRRMPRFLLAIGTAFYLATTGACSSTPFCAAASPSQFALNLGKRIDDQLMLWRTSSSSSSSTTNSCSSSSICAHSSRRGVMSTGTATRILQQASQPPPLLPALMLLSRGGAVASASSSAIKTMTARQFEAFNLLSGGVAGTVASCLTNPLEVIKTQLQSSAVASAPQNLRGHPMAVAQRIMEQDGLSGFFRGLPPTLIGIIPSRSAYFYAYQRVKRALGQLAQKHSPSSSSTTTTSFFSNFWQHFPEGSPPNALVAGFMAGIAGNTLTNPIWMVRTRMQLQADLSAGQRQYVGYGDVVTSIFREEGLGGFYRGIFASYWGCTEGAVQFLLYEQFKAQLLKRKNAKRLKEGLPPSRNLSRIQYFCSAAAAKMLASVATYPHEVARTRLREQARSGLFKYRGMWQSLHLIAQEEGSKALYSGLGVHLMKVVPNSAFMFLTYEIVRKWLSEYTIIEPAQQQ